jgi:hypothetical protein
MAQGPSKYDKECTLVRDSASAKVALVIVIGGDRGDGFAMQAGTEVPPSVVAQMLRNVAEQIERTVGSGSAN